VEDKIEAIKKYIKNKRREVTLPLRRAIIFIYFHCKSCRTQQDEADTAPWALNISGEVTDIVCDSITRTPTKLSEFGEMIEKFGELHASYQCNEALSLITKLYREVISF
jgi:hypothetical protein